MLKLESEGKIVKVTWLDSGSMDHWTDLDQISNEPPICISIGYIYLEDKKAITLVSSISDTEAAGIMTIPKKVIQKIQHLK